MAVEWGGIRLPVFYTPKVGELKQKCYIIPEPRAELFYFPEPETVCTRLSRSLHKTYVSVSAILSCRPFFHSYIFAMYKNEALWI